tara:strand:+ start:236 stop:1432 length:1197 start_codon:yes stop_codon:yes gene_type:complete
MASLRQNTWELEQWYDQAVAGTTGGYTSYVNKFFTQGYANYGQTGQNTTASISSPTQVGTDTDWEFVGTGDKGGNTATGSAIKNDGTFWTWGYNNKGQLGQNNLTNCSSPVQVAGTTWGQVCSRSFEWGAALKTDGTLWTWGENTQGQLGQSQAPWPIGTYDLSSPTQVPGKWGTYGAGYESIIGSKEDGTLWGWGNGGYGILGLNGVSGGNTLQQIGTNTNWSTTHGGISVGEKHSGFLTQSGDLFMTGWNTDGELGLNDGGGWNVGDISSPRQVPGTWASISLNVAGSSGVKTDGTLWTWGDNGSGQLGQNSQGDDQSSPVQVPGTNWDTSFGFRQCFMATKTDGSLWSWGANNHGELGHNDRTRYSSPTQIPGTVGSGHGKAGGIYQSAGFLKLI